MWLKPPFKLKLIDSINILFENTHHPPRSSKGHSSSFQLFYMFEENLIMNLFNEIIENSRLHGVYAITIAPIVMVQYFYQSTA